tara:strand:- start:519 stop:878 length:360 start_codon:yes stop_codon:yes gene_type:complete
MIKEGRDGCLVLYWKDKLMFGFPLGKLNTLSDYKHQANELMIDSLQKGSSIKTQIHVYKTLCECIYKRKMKNKKICTFDVQTFCCCVLSLIKFKVIDEDDVILICQKKKKRRSKLIIQR